jgi:hypothetical protein
MSDTLSQDQKIMDLCEQNEQLQKRNKYLESRISFLTFIIENKKLLFDDANIKYLGILE